MYQTKGVKEYDGMRLAEEVRGELELVADELTGRMVDDDYSEYLSSLKPGTTVSPKGFRLKTETYMRKLSERCEEAARNIDALCDNAAEAARSEMTEPPKQDALAYCQALAARKSVTVSEVETALRRYGANWTCYQIIMDVIHAQREAGEREFYRLDPRNTLDGWEKQIESMRREGKVFARNFIAQQTFGTPEELAMKLDQIGLFLGYEASNGGERHGVSPDTPSVTSMQAHAAASRGI